MLCLLCCVRVLAPLLPLQRCCVRVLLSRNVSCRGCALLELLQGAAANESCSCFVFMINE